MRGVRHPERYRITKKRISWDGDKDCFLHVFSNITSLLELERDKASVKFEKLMLSTISHEYRTPLNSIQGQTEIIAYGIEQF